jgi:hypothetical protein
MPRKRIKKTQKSEQPAETKGGLGGESKLAIRDTRLIEAAVRQRWPIDDAKRKPLMDRMLRIALNPKSSAREATSAARTIIHADRHNLEQEQAQQQAVDKPDSVRVLGIGSMPVVFVQDWYGRRAAIEGAMDE